jgi:hypothetical protein
VRRRWPFLRVKSHERHAQIVEIFGDVRVESPGRRRWHATRFVPHQAGRKRPPPGQRLVEHDADRVPIGGSADAQADALLGRHVLQRADDVLVRLVGAHVGDDTEVENHDATIGRDENIRRLDVAMDLARDV